jgi:hypothetical protein
VKYLIVGVTLFAAVTAYAQQNPVIPPLIACGLHADMNVICGVRASEDLEVTPDGRYLIVSQYPSFRTPGEPADLVLLNVTTQRLQPLAVSSMRAPGWGDASCSAPTALSPHGTSLTRRRDGKWELFVVNHAMRESIEMYELIEDRDAWKLVWRGCVVSPLAYNDVAALDDGSFVGTHPTALNQPGAPAANPQPGRATGWVAKWTASSGEVELPGTRLAYPNGVNASADGRYLYINAFGTREVDKYDVAGGKVVASAKVDFMPDNLTWTRDQKLIAAGVKGARGNCPPESSTPCIQAFGVARIDPATMASTPLFDSGARPIIFGVSVAIETGSSLYLGAFDGDRVVRMPMPAPASK